MKHAPPTVTRFLGPLDASRRCARALASLVAVLVLTTFGVLGARDAHAGLADPGLPKTIVFYDPFNADAFDVRMFRPAWPDACPGFHWHARNGSFVVSRTGFVLPDPAPSACGYGTFAELLPFVQVIPDTPLADADGDGLPDVVDPNPLDPDANNNGIIDSVEDGDNDGLTLAEELVIYQTSDSNPDSDMDGIIDSVDVLLDSTAKDFTKIPFLVNNYMGSGATEAHAREAIELANKILKKAKMMLVLVDVRENQTGGDDGSNGGTAQDGRFTDGRTGEGLKVTDFGDAEIAMLPGGKGMKVSMAQGGGGVLVGSTTPGFSYHRFPTVVCENRATTELTAATLAHEIFHVMTLDHPTNGSAEDTPGNIMTPSNAGRDDFVNSTDADKGLENLTLTPAQIARIRADGIPARMGVSGTMKSPAVKRPYEFGSVVDARGDQTAGQPDYLDIVRVSIAGEEDLEDIHVLFALGDTLPTTGLIDVRYSLLFDRDNNPFTGSTVNGVGGIEREITMAIFGDAATALDVYTFLIDYEDFSRTVLPAATVRPVTRRAGSSLLPDLAVGDLFELRMEQDLLGFAADDVPVTAQSLTQGSAQFGSVVRDTAELVYLRKLHESDPTLTVPIEYAAAGTMIPFAVSGLEPNTAFDLLLDSDVVVSDVLDGNGDYAGTFPIAAATPADFYFLTAQDATGAFAFSAVNVPEPSGLAIGLLSALALAASRSRRTSPSSRTSRSHPSRAPDLRIR